MTGRIATAACVAGLGALIWAMPGAAEPTPDKACKKGYLLAYGSPEDEDTDDNGFVCVDPETGEIRDDKGQFSDSASGDADENDNRVVCRNADGVVVDDDGSGGCPPGFAPGPNLGRGPAADQNNDGIVCYNAATDDVVDNEQTDTEPFFTCPPGYSAVPAVLV